MFKYFAHLSGFVIFMGFSYYFVKDVEFIMKIITFFGECYFTQKGLGIRVPHRPPINL